METDDPYALKPGSAQRLRAIRSAFARLNRRRTWRSPRSRWRLLREATLPAAVGVGLGVCAIGFMDMSERFGSSDLALRHVLAALDCDAARAQEVAPARRGHPGYYRHHDRDQDGVACEPYRGR